MSKRGENIYKRKDGRWEGRYYQYRSNGKRCYRSVYARSYSDVKQKLYELKISNSSKHYSCNLTVRELFTEWLNAVRLKVKPSTYSCYSMKIQKHILPRFGGMKYSELSVDEIHSFMSEKIESGLSAKYVGDIIIVFKSMAKYFSKINGYVDILKNVILPKFEKHTSALINEGQQQILVNFALKEKTSLKTAVMLSSYMGLRIGEVCGLKWSDVDLKNNTIAIKRTVQRIYEDGKTHLFIGSPKSKSSIRTIPIPKIIVDILKSDISHNDVFILSGTEKAVEPRTLQYRFKSLLKKANLPSVKYHSLRHQFATCCIRYGFDVKTLSEILGHSSVEVTLNRYVHSSLDRKKMCMNMMEEYF